MTEHQPVFIIEVKKTKDGEWEQTRNEKGELQVFLSDHDAVSFTKTLTFYKYNPYMIHIRIVKTEVLKYIGVKN